VVNRDRRPHQSTDSSQPIVLAESVPLKSLAPGKFIVTIRIKLNVRKQTVSPTESFELH